MWNTCHEARFCWNMILLYVFSHPQRVWIKKWNTDYFMANLNEWYNFQWPMVVCRIQFFHIGIKLLWWSESVLIEFCDQELYVSGQELVMMQSPMGYYYWLWRKSYFTSAVRCCASFLPLTVHSLPQQSCWNTSQQILAIKKICNWLKW